MQKRADPCAVFDENRKTITRKLLSAGLAGLLLGGAFFGKDIYEGSREIYQDIRDNCGRAVNTVENTVHAYVASSYRR